MLTLLGEVEKQAGRRTGARHAGQGDVAAPATQPVEAQIDFIGIVVGCCATDIDVDRVAGTTGLFGAFAAAIGIDAVQRAGMVIYSEWDAEGHCGGCRRLVLGDGKYRFVLSIHDCNFSKFPFSNGKQRYQAELARWRCGCSSE